MYYLQSRYYNPQVGRFLNADSQIAGVGGDVNGYNMFSYCMNNPVNMSDPTGHWPNWGKLISGIAFSYTGMSAVAAVALGALSCLNPVTVAAVAVAGVVCMAIGASEITEAFTGHNTVRDTVLKGNSNAYNAIRTASGTVASVATIVANTVSVCFVAGTYVLADSALIEIENIEVGDYVWSENPETGEKALKQVVQTFENETSELVHVFANNEEIVTTPEHPFYVCNQGWKNSIELRAGDILVLKNGKYVTVEKIQHEILENPITVYNFEVEDFHTYYVGESSILVHNTCSKGSTGRTTPTNLKEQLAMEQVKSNPLEDAKVINNNLNDSRWFGWSKMVRNVNGVEIHYNYNEFLKLFDDFKFID